MQELGRVQDRNAGGVNWTALGRWGGLLGGSALAIFGLTRSSRWGLGLAAAGGALAYGGTRLDSTPRQLEGRSSILVNCSVHDAYQFWRNFENLPRFMSRLDDVQISGDGHLTWTVVSGGSRLSWDTYIVNDRENQRIDWSSTPGSPVSMSGSVKFRPAPANRGTVVEQSTRFQAPGMGARRMVGQLIGKYPSFLMRNDLRRFKALMETGEIPTIEGQTHGPRSMTAVVARLVDPTRPVRPEHRNLSVLRRSA
ncbi:MAG TPA: SRPBCC family protein [Terriglobales bacterium]|nr:SRPBCC family protein [Terriglobales bacterium]